MTPISRRRCWIGTTTPHTMIECVLMDINGSRAIISLDKTDRVPKFGNLYLTEDHKVGRRFRVQHWLEHQAILLLEGPADPSWD